jgi:hypothetical protein
LNNKTQTWKRALFALGVSLCLAGALLMVHGSVFGDRTTGIAIVAGILGIGLISAYTTKPTLKNTTKPERIVNSAKRWQP